MPCIPGDWDDPNHADDCHWEPSRSFLQLLLLTDCPTRPNRIQKTHIPTRATLGALIFEVSKHDSLLFGPNPVWLPPFSASLQWRSRPSGAVSETPLYFQPRAPGTKPILSSQGAHKVWGGVPLKQRRSGWIGSLLKTGWVATVTVPGILEAEGGYDWESNVLGARGCSQIQLGGEMVAGHFDSSFPHRQPVVNKTLFKKRA